jgi:FKBP-type peptidyl-prolyl cis-trans isomerase FkpA
MNKFKLYFSLFCSVFILFSCNKADSLTVVPIRAFDAQYEDDIAIIEDYLTTHYIEIEENQDVSISKITNPTDQRSMMSYLNSETYPKLLVKEVEANDITYKIYYFKLLEDNETGIAPSKADSVLASYNGTYLSYKTETVDEVSTTTLLATQFEYTPFPNVFLRLDTAVRGWREILPLFRSGQKIDVPGEPTSYADFGAGVLFIPSGLGYFNVPQAGIPSYSPLVFSFKLYDVKYTDQDQDGILSNDEDLNGDGDFTNDDTDGDGVQNLYDVDDDGDSYLTKNEIKIDGVVPSSYSQILDCSGTTTGLKKHLDPNCN